MAFTTEDEIELYNLELLETLGYKYQYGYDIQPEGQHSERETFSDILLKDRLKNAIAKLNPDIPLEAREEAFKQITTLNTPDLLNNNETFHQYLTEGIDIEYQWNGESRGGKVWLIDFNHPENNEFLAVNQYQIIEDNHNRRPDIILFINGLPLVVIELKNASDEQADLKAAYNQLQTYKREIPSLFTYNALLIISDGLEARAGSLSADYNRFMAWKNPNGEQDSNRNELEILTNGILNKTTLIDFIRHFTVFEKIKFVNPETEVTTLQTIKKIAAYHQYYAVNKAVESVNKAVSRGDSKGGVVWHTQGSGKSLSMVFLAGKLVLTLDNPTIVVLTDRNDLDDQLFDTFAGCRQLLRQDPQQADNRPQVRELLNVDSGGIVFTTVQKFSPETNETLYPEISKRSNIIVLADEAHRSQYGFTPKEADIKDAEKKVIGKQTKKGFAQYMRDALPKAIFLGFTGTPVEQTDKNTPAVFGGYIDVYDIAQAVKDGATVPIYYESRLVKVDLDAKGKQLLDELDDDLQYEDFSATQKAKANQTQIEAVVGSTKRLKTIAEDIVTHFEQRQTVNRGKGMIVTMTRRIAAALYENIIKLRPDWHSDTLHDGKIKVVMTAAASDEPNLVKHHTNKKDRQILAQRLKDPDNSLELVIVCDMWLTGFDAPCLHTMYIDKKLKAHNLMQAIARINRVFFEKTGGLIVDYLGLAYELKKALSFYSQSGGRGTIVIDQEKAVGVFLTQLEIKDTVNLHPGRQMKIKELQERYGLKTRQSIYDWIKAAKITLPKDDRGHAYATPEQIEVLDQLVEHLKQGGTLGSFTPVSSPEIYTTADSQIDTSKPSTVYQIVDTVNSEIDTPIVMLERLVGAIISNIQPRSPLWFHDELEKAAKQGWILSSSEVEALIGVKPKGEIFHRGGWEFVRAGKIGNQGAWKVNKLEL